MSPHLFHGGRGATLSHVPSYLDQQLFLLLNADRGFPWLDSAMAILSSLDFWMPVLVFAAIAVLLRGGFRARAMLVCLLLSVGLMEGLFINPLKKAFGRPRPNEVLSSARTIDIAPRTPAVTNEGASILQTAGAALASTTQARAITQPARARPARVAVPPKPGKSFPSGHTANMFCFATVLAAFYGRRGAWFFAAATLVALSRVATGSHWPSDIIFTAALSVALTIALLSLYSWLWKTFAPRFVSALAARHPQLIARP